MVFFFSDHGVGLPRGKRSLYGTGTRASRSSSGSPRAGGPPASDRAPPTERLVSFVDFGPTVLSLAGVEPDQRLDGRAFLGEHEAAPRDVVFFHADRFDAARDRARGATDGRYLVIHNLLPEIPHLIPNAYRERLPMTADLYALRDGGSASWTRTPAQWQVGSTRRPVVEWYDSLLDPWEVRNLAEEHDLPGDRTERLSWLGGLLTTRGLGGAVDLGLIDDEAAMVAEHLWPPDGASADDGRARARSGRPPLLRHGGWAHRRPDGRCVAAVRRRASPRDAELETRAHRVGFQPSAVVTLGPWAARRAPAPRGRAVERGTCSRRHRDASRARTRSGARSARWPRLGAAWHVVVASAARPRAWPTPVRASRARPHRALPGCTPSGTDRAGRCAPRAGETGLAPPRGRAAGGPCPGFEVPARRRSGQ